MASADLFDYHRAPDSEVDTQSHKYAMRTVCTFDAIVNVLNCSTGSESDARIEFQRHYRLAGCDELKTIDCTAD